jgi:hypothetical protein
VRRHVREGRAVGEVRMCVVFEIVLYVYRPIESVTATHSQLVRAFVREGHGVPASRPYSKWLKGIGGNVAEV